MPTDQLGRVAELVRARNEIDAQIARITGRPVVAGHLGEWIASQLFDIELERSAVAKAIDGRFRSGPLAGQTVNVKWYGKLEGVLDMTADERLDHYLVLSGPRSSAPSSKSATRPLVIEHVHLLDARRLREKVETAGIKLGVATSIRRAWWDEGEIYPRDLHPVVRLSPQQREALALLADPHRA